MAVATQSPLTLSISKETSDLLLSYVAETDDASPEAIARFVEDAISRRLFAINSQKIRDSFSGTTPEQIDELVEEALAWARSPEGRACE